MVFTGHLRLADVSQVTGFGYEHDEPWKANIELFQHFTDKTQGVRRLGAAAVDLCHVALGRRCQYIKSHMSNLSHLSIPSLIDTSLLYYCVATLQGLPFSMQFWDNARRINWLWWSLHNNAGSEPWKSIDLRLLDPAVWKLWQSISIECVLWMQIPASLNLWLGSKRSSNGWCKDHQAFLFLMKSVLSRDRWGLLGIQIKAMGYGSWSAHCKGSWRRGHWHGREAFQCIQQIHSSHQWPFAFWYCATNRSQDQVIER